MIFAPVAQQGVTAVKNQSEVLVNQQ